MAKERVSRTICDRCKTVFEEVESEAKPETSTSNSPPKVYIEMGGEKVLSLDDLCKKCDDRVKNLITDIKLEKPAKKEKPEKKDKGSKPAEKKPVNKEDGKPPADSAPKSSN